MTPERLRAALQIGVLALLFLAPLPYGSVQPGPVLAIELTAGLLGLVTLVLLRRDEDAWAALPKLPLALCAGVIVLGISQIVPVPFSLADRFNPTTELVRPLIPYLGLEHPPAVSWSIASPETSDALLRFVAYVLIGLAAVVAFDSERSRLRVAFVLVLVAVFQAVYGSGEYLTGRQHIFGLAKRYYLDSATGTFINRNHFATVLAIALPFALTLAIPRHDDRRKRGWRERLVAISEGPTLVLACGAAASALIWMGLLLSHSRAGLLAAVAGAALVLFRFRRTRAARWTAALGTGVLLLLLTLELAQAPGERFFAVKDDLGAKAGRLPVWQDAMGLIAARPIFGWGFGTFENAFPIVQSADIDVHYDHAHNDWLEWAVEGGLPTLAFALALLALALAPAKRHGENVGAAVRDAARAALLAVCLHSLWDFSLRIPAIAVSTCVLLGLALSNTRPTGVPEGSVPTFRRTRSAGHS